MSHHTFGYHHGKTAEQLAVEAENTRALVIDAFNAARSVLSYVFPRLAEESNAARKATPDELYQMVQQDPDLEEGNRVSFLSELEAILDSGEGDVVTFSTELDQYRQVNLIQDTQISDKESLEYTS